MYGEISTDLSHLHVMSLLLQFLNDFDEKEPGTLKILNFRNHSVHAPSLRHLFSIFNVKSQHPFEYHLL